MPRTKRGFSYKNFKDGNGIDCSIQKSSSAMRDMIWLGADDIGLKKFIPFDGWKDIATEDNHITGISYVANNRMHLGRKEVKKLLPLLQKFVETGEIS